MSVKRPIFSWGSVAYGENYQVQISQNTTFTSPEKDVTVGALNYTQDVDLVDGKHYWRVRGINGAAVPGPWSAARNLTIDTLAPAAPVLKLPVDLAVVVGIPTYSWNASVGANAYRFGFDAASCSDPANKSAWMSGTSFKPAVQGTGVWKWCVQARDAAGNESAWSVARNVTVNPAVPAAPGLIGPLNGVITNNKRPGFSWASVMYGNTYEIQIRSLLIRLSAHLRLCPRARGESHGATAR